MQNKYITLWYNGGSLEVWILGFAHGSDKRISVTLGKWPNFLGF